MTMAFLNPFASHDPSAAAPPPATDPVPSAPVPAASAPKVGALVVHTYFDVYTNSEVRVLGIVAAVHVDVAENGDPVTRAAVAWLPSVSGPIPLDELTELH
jgi:hypothetical protein